MAMSLGSSGGVKSEINVTPLVDVMLVLLIIMMIVAPMLQKGVDVKLPVAANTTDKPETQDQTVVAVSADGRLFLNSVEVPENALVQRVQDALESKKAKIVLRTCRPSSALIGASSSPALARTAARTNGV